MRLAAFVDGDPPRGFLKIGGQNNERGLCPACFTSRQSQLTLRVEFVQKFPAVPSARLFLRSRASNPFPRSYRRSCPVEVPCSQDLT